jgi:dihydroflavonol-4-reductase
VSESGGSNSSALVTGASGFIGRHLVRTLLRRNRHVLALCRRPDSLLDLKDPLLRIIPGDLEDPRSYLPHLSKEVVVFHLAAIRARLGSTADHYRQVNEMASLKLAQAAAAARVQKFVYVSTAMVFGPSSSTAINEADGLSEPTRKDCYAQSRVSSLREMNKLVGSGLPLVTLCPTIVFGPDHPAHPNRITAQIRRLLHSGIDVVIGGGHQRRNLVFVEDVIRGILLAETQEGFGEVFILGGEEISHRDFNALIFALAGRKPRMRLSVPAGIALRGAKWLDWFLDHDQGTGFESTVNVLMSEWQYSSQKAIGILGYEWTPIRNGLLTTLHHIQGEVH